MFGKAPPPSQNLLNRVRQVTQPTAAGANTPRPPARERPSRQPVFRQATLIFDDGQRFPVAIKDVSESGARVEFLVHTLLPTEFVIAEPTLRLRRRVRVVWQREGIAGLKFVD